MQRKDIARPVPEPRWHMTMRPADGPRAISAKMLRMIEPLVVGTAAAGSPLSVEMASRAVGYRCRYDLGSVDRGPDQQDRRADANHAWGIRCLATRA
jgi:hypothetical protein